MCHLPLEDTHQTKKLLKGPSFSRPKLNCSPLAIATIQPRFLQNYGLGVREIYNPTDKKTKTRVDQ